MFELFKFFFKLCFLKKGPQDIPDSQVLLLIITPIYALISFLIFILSSDNSNAILQMLVELTLVFSLSWIILFFSKKLTRFSQTACALVGTDTVISFIALPILATLLESGAGLAFIIVVLLMLWHWIVVGHILSNALDQSFSFGIGIAFLYKVATYQSMALVFS